MRRTSGCSTIGAGRPPRRPWTRLAGVGQRLLVGALGDAEALMADGEARVVHHREHAAHALVLLADQQADRTVDVAIGHDAGRAGVDAQLVLERDAAQVVAPPGRAILVGQELGHDEQRDAPGAGGRAVEPRQHEVDDVLGQVVLAVGDEDLRAEDAVAVAVRLGPGADGADVGARLRLGQAHRAGPAAGDQRPAVQLALLLGAVVQEASTAPCVSSGQSWNARLAAYHISETAALPAAQGRPWPPSSSGNDRPVQPPSA